jgi:hypothetical protein
MIKDVMVHLDGSKADEARLIAVDTIAELFHGQIIGLFLNTIPAFIVEEGDSPGAMRAAALMQKVRETGDVIEKRLRDHLLRLQKPSNFGALTCLATRAPMLQVVRRAAPMLSWRCVPTPPSLSRKICSKAFSLVPAGISCSSPMAIPPK